MKKRRKTLAAWLLVLALLVLQGAGIGGTGVACADGDKAIAGLGASPIGKPAEADSADSPWSGSYVYYGKTGTEPVKYRVLDPNSADFGGTTMLLDCDRIFKVCFDDSSNEWSSSGAKAWLNGTFLSDCFTAQESAAIAESRKAAIAFGDGSEVKLNDLGTLLFTPLNGEKIFLLDIVEVTRKSYGYYYGIDGGTNSGRRKTGDGLRYWWLRSLYSLVDNIAGCVDGTGRMDEDLVPNTYVGLSPALNINLDSVLFSSEITSEPGSYKLTVLDSSREFSPTVGTMIASAGETISIPYAKATTGTNEYISMLLLDADNTIVYYASVAAGSVSGTAEFTLPGSSDLPKETYTLKVFNEQQNGGKLTDYSSAMTSGTLNVADRITYIVTFKVKNGEWNDGGSEDKKVELSCYENEDKTLKLEDGDIPVAGNKPAAGYQAGDWDVTPDTDTAITDDKTYTYTYVEVPTYTLTATAPDFDDMVYGYAQPDAKGITIVSTGNSNATISSVALSGTDAGCFTLNRTIGTTITAGSTDNTTYTIRPVAGLDARDTAYTATITVTYDGGATITDNVSFTVGKATQTAPAAPTAESVTENSVTLKKTAGYQYSIDGTNWQDSPVFTGLSPDTEYTFYQRIAGDANHEPSPASPGTGIMTGNITYTVSESQGTEHTAGSGENAVYTVKRNVNDADTFKNYSGAAVDGKAVPAGGSTAEAGSLVLTLKSSYLDTLSAGDHKVTISFTDGTAESSLKIKAAAPTPSSTPAPTPSPAPLSVPKTGDNSTPVLWYGLILLGIAGLAVLGVKKASRKRK